MELRTELVYPGASPEQVRDLAHDREFREAVCRATHALEYTVDITVRDGATHVEVRRTLPAAVPAMVKHLVGETVQIVQTEDWAASEGPDGYRADLTVQVVGQPATMRGSIEIAATDSATVQVVQGDVRVTMPFIGKKFEAELAKGIVAAGEREQQVGREWLAR